MNIIKVWVDNTHVNIEDDKGVVLQEAIANFPRLLYATDKQRQDFEYDNVGIHWRAIDEDLSFEGFTYPKEQSNSVAMALKQLPMLNISMLAKYMGIPQSVFASYLCGVKKPSEKRKKEIEDTLHKIGKELASIQL